MNALIWNIRSVNTQQQAFTILITMQMRYHFYFIGIMEPFQDDQHIENYRRRLGMKHALVNASGKIWAFRDEIVEFSIVKDEEQQLSLKLANQHADVSFIVTWYMQNALQMKDWCYGIP